MSLQVRHATKVKKSHTHTWWWEEYKVKEHMAVKRANGEGQGMAGRRVGSFNEGLSFSSHVQGMIYMASGPASWYACPPRQVIMSKCVLRAKQTATGQTVAQGKVYRSSAGQAEGNAQRNVRPVQSRRRGENSHTVEC